MTSFLAYLRKLHDLSSHKFGYGLLDAGALVEAAATWRQSPPQVVRRYTAAAVNVLKNTLKKKYLIKIQQEK